MKPLQHPFYISFFILILIVILGLFEITDWDLIIQNYFYLPNTEKWLMDDNENPILKLIFYKGFKHLSIIIGSIFFILFIISFFNPNYTSKRYQFLFIVLSIIFVPLIIAGSKKYTNTYCPDQLTVYNGDYPYVKLLEKYPHAFHDKNIEDPGRCFPAGHATSGFMYLGFIFYFRKLKNRFYGFLFGTTMGWIAGLFQMLRGEHFLSHTLVSYFASILVVFLLNEIFIQLKLFPQKNDI